MTRPNLSRRRFLGIALGAAALPTLAWGQQGAISSHQEPAAMRVRFSFNGLTMLAGLYDNPSARDFFSMLPLDLTIGDFGTNEKIAYLPRKLTEQGSGPFGNEQPCDLCYYVPWGNLAMFYAGYRHPGLIRLGRFEQGCEALHERGEFPLRVEAI